MLLKKCVPDAQTSILDVVLFAVTTTSTAGIFHRQRNTAAFFQVTSMTSARAQARYSVPAPTFKNAHHRRWSDLKSSFGRRVTCQLTTERRCRGGKHRVSISGLITGPQATPMPIHLCQLRSSARYSARTAARACPGCTPLKLVSRIIAGPCIDSALRSIFGIYMCHSFVVFERAPNVLTAAVHRFVAVSWPAHNNNRSSDR